jgi:hypothetical protein
MAERAAHLVDHVFPDVPVRQWVLSLPYRLRYRLAWDHDLCRAVVAVYMRAVLGWLRRRAQLEDVADGRGGAVAVIQRFGGALNLNVHIHALVLDGVFAKDRAGPLVFHPTSNLTALDVAEVLATVAPGIARLLNRRGIGEDADSAGEADAWTDEAPVLAGLAAASVQGRVALGRQRGTRIRRLGVAPDEVTPRALGRCHARSNGCDLHAGLVVPAGQRERLERVCRYALRPPVARERLSVTRGRCGCSSGSRGRTVRPIWSSTRLSSWDGWRYWCLGRGSTSCSTTVSSGPARPGGGRRASGGDAGGGGRASNRGHHRSGR